MKNESREKLRLFFAEQCLILGTGIKLSAGGSASFYFDCKRATLNGECLITVADWILDDIAPALSPPADFLGGPTMGADFIAAAVAVRAAERGMDSLSRACIVRRETKEYGAQNFIENAPPSGARVLVVEDVITTGGSASRACEALLKHGCEIAGIAALIDRGNIGREVLEQKYRVKVHALFNPRDFAAWLEREGEQ